MFVVPESIISSNVMEFRECFLDFWEELEQEEDKVVFDFAKLQDIDTSGLQMLLAICKSISDEKRCYVFENVSTFVNHVFELAGVSGIGGIKENAGSL